MSGSGGQFGGASGRAATRDSRLGLTTGKITGKSAYGPAGGNAVGMGAPGYENPQATASTLAKLGMPNAVWDGNSFANGQKNPAKITPASLAQIRQGIPVPGMSPAMLAQIQAYLAEAPPTRMDPGIISKMLQSKSIYDRMPEYDRVPGYGDQQWNSPNPQMGNNLVNRIQNPANGGSNNGPGFKWQ